MPQSVSKRQLFEWLAGVFQEDAGGITMERARDTIPTWDSMGTLLLIAEIDDKLKVTLTEDDLQNLSSIGDIVEALRRKQVEVTD